MAGKWSISTPQMVRLDSGTLPHIFGTLLPVSVHVLFLSQGVALTMGIFASCLPWLQWTLRVLGPQSLQLVSERGCQGGVVGECSQRWLRTERWWDKAMTVTHLCPGQVLAPVPVKGAVLSACRKTLSLRFRILRVATQPCDSLDLCKICV